ncbi:MAG: hypothetical protein ACN4GG_02485 [Akkermansiaceae bacterium]
MARIFLVYPDMPLPESRKSPEELASLQSLQRPAPANAAVAQPPRPQDFPLSVGDWILTILILAIPFLNIVLYLYWAFFSNGNQSRINFCRASVIIAVVAFIVLGTFSLMT